MRIRTGANVQFQGQIIAWPPFPQAENAQFECAPLPGKKWVCTAPGFGLPNDHGHGPVVVMGAADIVVSNFIEGIHHE